MMAFSKEKMPVLKASLALLIVMAHFTFFIESRYLAPFREIGPSVVALFIFISGYGLSLSYDKKGRAYLDHFLSRRLLQILIPAGVALLLHYLLNGSPSGSWLTDASKVFREGIFPLPQLWFVGAITYYYLLYYFAYKYLPYPLKRIGLWVGALVFLVLTCAAGYDRCWWICALAFPTGASFFARENQLFTFCKRSLLHLIACLALLAVLTLCCFLTGNPYIWTLCYVFIPVFAALLIAILPIDRIQGAVVRWLGSIYYEIYLCHGIAMAFLRGERFYIQSDGLFVLLVFALTLILASLLHILCKR